MSFRYDPMRRAAQKEAQRQAGVAANEIAMSFVDIGKMTGQMVAAHYAELVAGGVPDEIAKALMIEYQQTVTGMLNAVVVNELNKK